MNKYEKKILELAPSTGTIHELLRRPVRSRLVQFFDMMFDNVLFAFDGLKSKGAYFLLIEDTKAELVHITPDLDISKTDVTSSVQSAENKNSFIHDNHRYKLFRKIR